jgi:hypothetical protein
VHENHAALRDAGIIPALAKLGTNVQLSDEIRQEAMIALSNMSVNDLDSRKAIRSAGVQGPLMVFFRRELDVQVPNGWEGDVEE